MNLLIDLAVVFGALVCLAFALALVFVVGVVVAVTREGRVRAAARDELAKRRGKVA